MTMSVRRLALVGTILGGSLILASGVRAQTAAPAADATTAAPAADAAPAAPSGPVYGIPVLGPIKLFLQGEGGLSFSPSVGKGTNFGQLFTDKANSGEFNQLQFGIGKDVDPKATDFDWGFRLLGIYGSDVRYTRFIGEFDSNTSSRYKVNVLEADISLHLPVLTDGGIDVKAGQYPTPLGYEVIDPKGNPFYSHSYIFNFGLPLVHTGGYATIHATDLLDIWGGIDTGVNTSIGDSGNPNGGTSFIAGLGLNMMDGNLTVLGLTHIGPANPGKLQLSATKFATLSNANSYYNDVVVTYKPNDKLTLVTEANWVHADKVLGGNGGDAYGAAQYASYTVSDTVTANLRGEVYRDNNGDFVAAYPGVNDPYNAQIGRFNTSYNHGASTYGELTAGVTIAPSVPPLNNLLIRPEVRYDHILAGKSQFGSNGHGTDALTFASDLVIGF